jgi:hypothetical protein
MKLVGYNRAMLLPVEIGGGTRLVYSRTRHDRVPSLRTLIPEKHRFRCNSQSIVEIHSNHAGLYPGSL